MIKMYQKYGKIKANDLYMKGDKINERNASCLQRKSSNKYGR